MITSKTGSDYHLLYGHPSISFITVISS